MGPKKNAKSEAQGKKSVSIITVEEAADRELAAKIGNKFLQKLLERIINPPDPNAYKTDGLVDWIAKRKKRLTPKRRSFHDHRRSSQRISWALFGRRNLLTIDDLEQPEILELPSRPSIQYSQVRARTSSWRAPEGGSIDGAIQTRSILQGETLISKEDLFRPPSLVTQPKMLEGNEVDGGSIPPTNDDGEGEDGEKHVRMGLHAFDSLEDFGGDENESAQIEEVERMAEAIRLEQEKIEDHLLRPWKSRSFRQSWRAPLHNHPKPQSFIPWRRFGKLEFPFRFKTALSILMPKPGQDWRLLPKEGRESWRVQMPATKYFLECKLLERMMKRINYLNNPRYSKEPRCFQALEIYQQKNPVRLLPYWIEAPTKGLSEYDHLNPVVVVFDGFEPGKIYVAHLYVKNKSPWSQRLRIIKPSNDEFSMSSEEEPFQGKILISGMFCKFDVIYSPKTVYKAKDEMEVRSEMDTCVVKLVSIHPLPTVVFPAKMDLGYCLTGHSKSTSFSFVSQGAAAHFTIHGFCDDLERNFLGTKWSQDVQWKDLQERYANNNFALFWPFIAYPRMVKLQAEQSQEIIILFRPLRVGKFLGSLKIETSTGRHWEILVIGYAVDLQIGCNKIDGRSWRPGELEMGINYGDCCVGGTTSHEITIQNSCEVPLRFYWRVSEQDEISLSRKVLKEREQDVDAKDVHWEVEREFIPAPCFGVFSACIETNVTFRFTPLDLNVYRQLGRLYIDTGMDESLASNEWKSFRDRLFIIENEIAKEETSAKSCDSETTNENQVDTYKLSNEAFAISKIDNMGKIFKLLELHLVGKGITLDVLLLPPLLVVGGGLIMGTVRNFKFIICNNSPSVVHFSWERPKTPIAGISKNSVYFQPLTGNIPANANQDIFAILKAKKIGAFEAEHVCRVANPSKLGEVPLLFRVEGHVRGPILALSPAMLNYGLVQIESNYKLDLTLTNNSGTRAIFKLYSTPDPEGPAILTSRDKPVALSTYGDAWQLFKDSVPLLQSNRQKEYNHFTPFKQLIPLPLVKVCRRVWYPPGVPYPEDDWKQNLVFYPSCGVLDKHQSCTIRVVLTGTKCGYLRLAIVCETEELGSPTTMAVARAEIDAPRACLLPPIMDLGIQYLYCEIERTITIRNLRALPACFNWWSQDGVGDHKYATIQWSQVSGKIPPRNEIDLVFKFTPQRLGPFECILVCEVWKQQFPLGLLLKAYIVDIRVTFHVFPLDVEDGHQLPGRGVHLDRIQKTKLERSLPRRSTRDGRPYETLTLDPPDIPCLDFGRRQCVGQIHSLKLVIRNHSPITANVRLRVINHLSEPHTSLIREELWMLAALTGHLSTLNPNTRDPFLSALIQKKKDVPLLGREDELHFRFFSSAGKSMLWRRVEGAMHQAVIKEGRSIAFLLYPYPSGVLKAWGEWSCEVVCFSTLPGKYLDTIVCTIGRLSPFYFPVEIELLGNPLISRINYLEPRGLQDIKKTPELVLTWNTMPAGNSIVRRLFWIYNSSPFHMVIEWEVMMAKVNDEGSLFTMSFNIQEDQPEVHTMLVPERSGEDWCVRVCLQEHLGTEYQDTVHVTFKDFLEAMPAPPPFQIAPKKQVILGQSSSQFAVTFQSLEATDFKATLVGRTRIYDGQFIRRPAAPKFDIDRALDPINKQYIFRRPSAKHVCEHVVTFFSHRTSQFQSVLVHKTSLGDHVHLEQLNQRKVSKKGGPWADFGRKRSKVHRLEYDSDVSDDENSTAKELLTEEGGYAMPTLDIPDSLIIDAFAPDAELDLIRPLRVTLITRLLVPSHGLLEPVINGEAVQQLSILKNLEWEAEEAHFRLPRDWSLQLTIRFRPYVNEGDWHPADEVIERDLVIKFQDANEQVICLYANLYFPEVTLLTETLWFGTVVCPDCVQTIDFSISNTSFVPLEWRIVTEQSHEAMVECAELDGFMDWSHLKDLNKSWPVIWKATPESGRLPGREGYMAAAHKQIVSITFSPHNPITYKEVVWIEVFRGRGWRLVMEGDGKEEVIVPPVLDPTQAAGPPPGHKDSKRKSSVKKK